MKTFTIHGARRETAESVEISLVAGSEDEATAIVNDMDVLVSDVASESKPQRRRYVVISIVGITILGFVVVASVSSSSLSSPKMKTVMLRPILAWRMYQDYQQNEVQADNKYKGKPVLVVGVISSIGKDITGTPYVTLQTTSNSMFNVQCLFSNPKEIKKLGELQRWRWISIAGWGDGSAGNILLDDCSIIANRQIGQPVAVKFQSK